MLRGGVRGFFWGEKKILLKRHSILASECTNVVHIVVFCKKRDDTSKSLSDEDYDNKFSRHPAMLVLYDGNIIYLFSSTKLNDIATNMEYHSIIDEMLEKARLPLDCLGCSNADDNKWKNRLHCLLRITSQRLSVGETSYKDMRIEFCDYVSLMIVLATCWVHFQKFGIWDYGKFQVKPAQVCLMVGSDIFKSDINWTHLAL